jgi:NAD(P)-dependent dehydrogenase (short-subunit alcohol dehydrogenase family)
MANSVRNGKTALVTGGTRGIGFGVSQSLAAAGYDLAVHARTDTAVARAKVTSLTSDYGVETALITADLNDPNSIEGLFEHFDREFLRLDVLVNNAGVENYHAAEDLPLAEWQHILQVNLTAPFQCSQLAARRMKGTGNGGVIINISSIHDTVARKGISHYCCAKAGLRMLTRVTALEWAEYGIRVVTVSPGAIETDMNRDAIEGFGRDKFNQWIPVGRVGNTADIGAAILFLCDDRASYITGTELYIDGAYSLNLVRYDDRPGRSDLRPAE